ncbi:MAG: NACHT domain-containing protein [Chloroflexi bacterium]|nr:MAG: NACHT domain-containing protein [Chloroflexota bacterium]
MPHNLPSIYNPFLGRQAIQQIIHVCLDQPRCKPVILVGSGGIGKTRLATVVARNRLHLYPDGVWLVNLTDIASDAVYESDGIANAIASVLDLPYREGVSSVEQLLAHLEDRALLLLLDGFEHLSKEGEALLSRIWLRCPDVHLLVTSRRVLDERIGHMFVLYGLGCSKGEEGDGALAVSLFEERRAQYQWMPLSEEERRVVYRICSMVEGMPLAIELAAGLTVKRTVQEIAIQMASDFYMLESSLWDVPVRHRSLQAVFESSWCRLSVELQGCLARLAVFSDDFTAVSAEQVAQTTRQQLAALQKHSLLAFNKLTGLWHMHPIVRFFAERALDG